jgi:hypothetical protein
MAEETTLAGTAIVEVRLKGEHYIASLVDGWTGAEKAALLDGKGEAMKALFAEATRRTVKDPDEIEADPGAFRWQIYGGAS